MRKLAGSFTEGLPSKLGIKIGSDHALWAWAARHVSWVLNRIEPVMGATPYELVPGKSYKGLLPENGESVLVTSTNEKHDGIYACSVKN